MYASSQIYSDKGKASPSPPLGAERAGVRWGIPSDAGAHLTLPSLRDGPLPLPPEGPEGRRGISHRPGKMCACPSAFAARRFRWECETVQMRAWRAVRLLLAILLVAAALAPAASAGRETVRIGWLSRAVKRVL